jgi:hypothetical protein
MADENHSDHVERPRSEPEIIPPGRGDDRHGRVGTRYEDAYGVHRIYIARPGLSSILLGLFIVGAIVSLGILILVGVLLLWLPIVVAGILLALFYGPVRDRWYRLRDWLSGWR